MEIEYEAKFLNINKDEIRDRLQKSSAVLEQPEAILRRWVFDLPKEKHTSEKFVRVRDEWGSTVMTWKEFSGKEIDHPKEIELNVDNFDNAVEMLREIGCNARSYQESKRELWRLGDVEICIDTWPFYETYIEIEGRSQAAVEDVAEKLKLDWSAALFCGVNKLFEMKYGPGTRLQNTPRITFDMPNPFI